MVVVNVIGFTYKVTLRNGTDLIIPADNKPHLVSDELAELGIFDNVFKVLVPPKPKIYPTMQPTIESTPNIIEINVVDPPKTEDNTKAIPKMGRPIKARNPNAPLAGVRIKGNKKEKRKNIKEKLMQGTKPEENNTVTQQNIEIKETNTESNNILEILI
jgi:hypothetical protein